MYEKVPKLLSALAFGFLNGVDGEAVKCWKTGPARVSLRSSTLFRRGCCGGRWKSLESLQQHVNNAVGFFVFLTIVLDLADGVDDGAVMLAAEGATDLGQ